MSTSKVSKLRVIDTQIPLASGANPPITSEATTVPPAGIAIPPPTGLIVVANQLYVSAVTPSALLDVTWTPPSGVPAPITYVIQHATDSGFTANVVTLQATDSSARLIVPAGRLHYLHVAAIVRGVQSAWSDSVSVTAALDTAPASQPTSAAYQWSGADLILTWTNPGENNFRDVEVRIWNQSGGTLLHTGYSATGRYVWTLAQQRQDLSGALDATVYVELRSRTWHGVLNSTSIPSLTPSNAAPAAPTSVAVISAPGLLMITVTATQPLDFAAYRYRLIQTSPSAADVTWDEPSSLTTRAATVNATYQVGVRTIDVYGQVSTETLSSANAFDQLTISELRADILYEDSISTSTTTLKAALADDSVSSGGITYAIQGAWGAWLRARRALADRYRRLTVSMTPLAGSTTWYLRLSSDGITWRYFSGPTTSGVLTEVASAAAAQTAAIASTTLGNPTNTRVILPVTIEARFMEVWWRNTTGQTRIDEYYPRRYIVADDLNVETLGAISGNLGTITAGSITGATIQTAATGARIELTSANGLRSFDGSGTVQSQLRTTDGAQLWGNGNVIADRYGMSVVRDTLTLTGAEPPVPYYQPISERQYRIVNGTTVHGGLGGTSITTTGSGSVDNQILLLAQQVAGQDSQLFLMAQQDTLTSEVRLSANDGAANGSYLALTNVPSIPANGSITVDGPKVLIKPITTIGSLNAPAATLDVYRGLSGNGTAMFRGTTHNSHFNYGSTEDTYLRGGKTDAAIYLNDSHTGPVYVGASAFVPAVSKLRVHASVVVGNALNNDSLAATFAAGTGAGNAVGLSVRPYRIVAGSDWTGVSMILQRFTDTTYQTPYLSFSPTGGRIGLNVLNPSYEFQLSSDSAGKPGSSTWTVVSDARTKHAATRPFGLGLDWLRGVSPVYFAYNGLAGTPTDGEYLGVIAQDAPAEMVRRTRGRLRVEDAEETEILGTSLDPVVYALRNAVLELAERLTRVERIRTP